MIANSGTGPGEKSVPGGSGSRTAARRPQAASGPQCPRILLAGDAADTRAYVSDILVENYSVDSR